MAQEDTSFRDLVARLNAMSNLTPEEERMQMMESVGKAPKVLDDKEVTLADIAKLAGIKEYVAPLKQSKNQTQMFQSQNRSKKQSRKSPADWTRSLNWNNNLQI
jgi:hypothetical protein